MTWEFLLSLKGLDFVYLKALALILVGSKLLHPEEPEVTGGQQRSNCTSGSQVTGHDRGRVFSQIKFKIPTR